MNHLTHWLAALTGTAVLSAFALAGCGGDDSSHASAVDASMDSTTDVSVADAATGTDAGLDASACPVDANILAPVDAAADPAAAACRACLTDAATMVPSLSGSGTCIANFEACNEDCMCREGVVGVQQCVGDGGSEAFCLLSLPVMTRANIPFKALLGCQSGPCADVCGDGADAGDASFDAQADTGTDAAPGVDGASDGAADANRGDASAADASAIDATATPDGGTADATAVDASAGEDGGAADATPDDAASDATPD